MKLLVKLLAAVTLGWVEQTISKGRVYSGLQPLMLHLRLCSGTLKGAATQTKRFRCI